MIACAQDARLPVPALPAFHLEPIATASGKSGCDWSSSVQCGRYLGPQLSQPCFRRDQNEHSRCRRSRGTCYHLIPHNPQPTQRQTNALLFNDFCFRPRERRAHHHTG
jgi:hypothetical protein